MIKDMTAGSPIKLIMTFAVPVLIGNIFQQLYNISDILIVGRLLGVEALAAVGVTFISVAAYSSEISAPCFRAFCTMATTSMACPASARRQAASKIARSAATSKSSARTCCRTARRQAASISRLPATL